MEFGRIVRTKEPIRDPQPNPWLRLLMGVIQVTYRYYIKVTHKYSLYAHPADQ
jgi:hypothetical protein